MTSALDYGIELTERDRGFLNGDHGQGAAMAMRVLLSVGRAMGARELIDIESAHVDGCIYIGSVSTDFARALADGGAQVSVRTTLNIGSVDLLHPELWNGDQALAEQSRELMELYSRLGCSQTWTCAPYQLAERPSTGSHVAWGESNAIVFANSVLGARTQRYGDFVDISAAIVGRVPEAGLHLDEGRHGQIEIDVREIPADLRRKDAFFPLLGFMVGRWCGGSTPVVIGLDGANEDQLKAFGAAAASTGAIALFHVVGVTPEAPTAEAAFGGKEPVQRYRVTIDDLRRSWTMLTTRAAGTLGAVCLGTPHYSVREFQELVRVLDGRTVHPETPFYVNTGRFVYSEIEKQGLARVLAESGVQIVTDTCTYTSPVMAKVDGLVMTNSGKWAWYAPKNLGVDVLFADLDSCVTSAVEGRIVNHDLFA